MNIKKRRISSLSRTKKKDQSLKKLLICLKNTLKIFSVILLLSGATAQNEGLHHKIHLEKCLSYTHGMLILLMNPKSHDNAADEASLLLIIPKVQEIHINCA